MQRNLTLWGLIFFFGLSAKALTAPTSLAAKAVSSSQVTLTWSDNATVETGYSIERSLSSLSGYSQIARVGQNVVRYSNTGLKAATTYYYRVRTYRIRYGITSYSNYSNIVSVKTPAATSPTPTPAPMPAPAPAPAPSTGTTLFFDDFSSQAITGCMSDDTVIGSWISVYNGYGCNSIVAIPEGRAMSQKPMASTQPDETHAGLYLGPQFSGSYTYEATVKTQEQLRLNSAPNAWEVAWLVWNYTDDTHFYYFAPKTNGWELGKEDPAYPGAQRYLATGSYPTYPIGQWLNVKIIQNGNVISVSVNGVPLTTFTDNERPYSTGRIGFYNEDAHVYLKSVKVTAP